LSPPSSDAREERLLAIRATDAVDLLTRISVLVSRRGAVVSSAIGARNAASGNRTLAVVVAGAPRVVARLPLWIAGVPDVLEVRDLSAGGEAGEPQPAAVGSAIHSQERNGPC
jgi:acetolactate synthase regulatory subunit